MDAANPLDIALGGLRWRVRDKAVTCVERLAQMPAPSPSSVALHDAEGRVLWAPPKGEGAAWSVHRAGDGRAFAFRRGTGVEVFALREP